MSQGIALNGRNIVESLRLKLAAIHDCLLLQLLDQLVLDFAERTNVRHDVPIEAKNVITELGFHDIRELAWLLHCKCGVLKWFDHSATPEFAQISTFGSTARIFRTLFCQHRKISALFQLGQNLFSLRLGSVFVNATADQNMADLNLFRGFIFLRIGLVF